MSSLKVGGSVVCYRRREAGDIVTGWLLRLVIFLAVLTFLIFEGVALGLNMLTLEDATQEAVRAAANAYAGDGNLDSPESAAVAILSERDVRLVRIAVDGPELSITTESSAGTLLIHHVDLLSGLVVRQTTRTSEWR